MSVTFDHSVLHVSDWEAARAFYVDVIGCEAFPVGMGYAFRLGGQQLNCHGPDKIGTPVARLPVLPGGSDLCFRWPGPIAEAIAHLDKHGISVELGPVECFGAGGTGQSVYFRDPDGSLMEFISYVQT